MFNKIGVFGGHNYELCCILRNYSDWQPLSLIGAENESEGLNWNLKRGTSWRFKIFSQKKCCSLGSMD